MIPVQDDGAGGQKAGHGRRDEARGEQHDHRDQNGDGLARARPHWHGLAAHQLGRAHDQDIRVVEMDVQGLPGSLQQHRVAGLQHDRRRRLCLRRLPRISRAGALDGQDDRGRRSR